MKFLLIFTILLFFPFLASADVIISEVAWMGTENSANDEWVELRNTDNEDVDLTGWILEAADGSPSINLEGNITANSYFLLERTDDTSVPDITADQIYTGALSNSSEHLKLKNSSGAVVDEINATNDWPAGDNTTKQTMERTATGWQTSLNPRGTPKAQNSSGMLEEPIDETEEEDVLKPDSVEPGSDAAIGLPIARAGNDIIGFIGQEINFDGIESNDPNGYELAYSWNMGNGELIEKDIFTYKYLYQGTYLVTLMVYNGRNYAWDTITVKIQNQEITINEFIPDPIGSDDAEWIEIYNDSNSIVDISGWQLDDRDGGSKPFIFPENTLIAPKNYLVFPKTITNIALNNTSDSVRLLLPEGIVFQEINYEDCKQGQSSARADEGFVWAVPTPGMANIISIPESIGGQEKQVVYQGETKKEIVKQPSQEYVLDYSPPEQEIEGGYTTKELIKDDSEDDLAMVSQLLTQGKGEGAQSDATKTNQTTTNLILMIIIVILTATIIGLFLAKFLKPKNPYG